MKKNAFTLIELLAVIILLGVVGLIVVPTVTKIVENVKNETYILNKKNFLKAVKDYVVLNEELLPKNGESKTVTIEELIKEKRFKPIISSFNNEICLGYVVITKLDNGDYEFSDYLACEKDIKTVEDDKLLAHYKFIEFQEPTVNLYKPSFVTIGKGITLVKKPDENGYTKYGISGTWTGEEYPYIGSFNHYNYKGLIPYSVSVQIYTNVPEKFKSFGTLNVVNDYNMTGTRLSKRDGYFSSRSDYIHSRDYSNSVYLVSTPKNNGMTFNPDTDFIYYKEFQLEQKSYTTPYTEGKRDGIIKDFSGNKNIINLSLENTPMWTEEGYKFNGDNTRIDIPNLNIKSSQLTASIWIKPSSKGQKMATIITPQSTGYDQIIRYDYEKESASISVAEAADKNEKFFSTKNNTVKKGQWSLLTFSVNENVVKLYLNGKLVINETVDYKIAPWSGNWVIGHRGISNVVDTTRRYNGLIGEIIIKERVMTDKEIEIEYLESKDNYVS